ncbi:MAG: bifunctional folylpolyglutamate synthase/dihydrofolate synthase [Candidatus Eisenbacteria bacterium]|nr:bifunctional folylpolyglutamate synthase/dihydrofolate synthase [Candidatus Latescibacterota bacterium]MBD3301566.1 bifunctional folylpolyglutamate synthase/dihydrofolate synthase [Candidatus Eisenbacteria bacterium]
MGQPPGSSRSAVTYEDSCATLFSLERRGVRLGLDRIVGAFAEHGDPQESFGSILVGGTNGKGSACAMAASCLDAAGLRTGLFTSPHLVDFRERMRIGGEAIAESEVADLVPRIRGSIERWKLSFFEATTLLAFVWFRERGVEAAAVEVGLGGRLDATRPVRALATIVTGVDLDHLRILGPNRAAIAGEKAGIFRRGVPVVLGNLERSAGRVLRDRAREVDAPIFERRMLRVDAVEPLQEGSRLRIASRPPDLTLPSLSLRIRLSGIHQVANAALVVLALRLLPEPFCVGMEAIRSGLGRLRWPGRFERIEGRPPVLLDVAHNPHGARALARAIRERGLGPVRLVVGMVGEKDHRGFLSALRGVVGPVHYCAPPTDRALPAPELAEIGATVGLPGTVCPDPADALERARAGAGAGETILATGSIFLIGALQERLGSSPVASLWEPDVERTV